MPTKKITGLKIPFARGIEGFFRTFEFVSAGLIKNGILEITIRERRLLLFYRPPRTYCGSGSKWTDAAGNHPPTAEALYLCQCWMVVMQTTARRGQHFIYENPLRM